MSESATPDPAPGPVTPSNTVSRAGALPRLEDGRLVTGVARYVADLNRADVLHAAFARSTHPHGRLMSVDAQEARGAPGVAAALTAADLAVTDIPDTTGRGPSCPTMTRPVLARERVRYVGEPLAMVVASSRYQAADAVDMVSPEIDPLPVASDPRAAMENRTLLFPEAGTNVVGRREVPEAGSATQTADTWPVRVTVEVENQRLAPVSIEPLGVLAEVEGDGLIVHCGHQAPHRLRIQLSSLLGLDREQVRVVVPDVGGAFGLKGMLFPEYVAVAAAALRLREPIMWIETRQEHFLGGTHGRGQHDRLELAGEPDGRIRSARLDILADLGAYPHNGSQIPGFTGYVASEMYDIADIKVRSTLVVTNRAPTGSYRGAGRPEAAYAMERAIDAFAHEVGLDPAEVRRKNFVRSEDLPYRTPTGALYDSGDYAAALNLALKHADAETVRAEQAARQASGENPIGLGIGAFIERAGGALGSPEYARVELDASGTVVVRVGTAASGQGHQTTWSQLAADVMGVAPGRVRVHSGDTFEVADGLGSFGSRSAQLAGSAIWRGAGELAGRVRALTAELLEAAPGDLVLANGYCRVRGDPRSGVSLAEVAEAAARSGAELATEERYDPGAQTFPYGVHVAIVEVDLETGQVRIRTLVAVDDCGNVLNPTIVEGQVHGSLMQGIAQALYEGLHYDEEGQLVTSTVADYCIPTAYEAPELVTDRLVSPAPSNPLGVKGAGESGCIGAPPAIVNATLDALRPYGVRDLQMPLTPEHVWRAIQAH